MNFIGWLLVYTLVGMMIVAAMFLALRVLEHIVMKEEKTELIPDLTFIYSQIESLGAGVCAFWTALLWPAVVFCAINELLKGNK